MNISSNLESNIIADLPTCVIEKIIDYPVAQSEISKFSKDRFDACVKITFSLCLTCKSLQYSLKGQLKKLKNMYETKIILDCFQNDAQCFQTDKHCLYQPFLQNFCLQNQIKYTDWPRSKYNETVRQAEAKGFPVNDAAGFKKLIQSYGEIKELKMSYIQIVGLKKEIGKVLSIFPTYTSITELDLRSNEIKKINFIFKFPNLKILGLGGNKVEKIPVNGVLNKLEFLNLFGNQIKEIPKLDENFPKLEKLHCSANKIEQLNMTNHTLTELRLSANPIKEIDLTSSSLTHLFLERMETLPNMRFSTPAMIKFVICSKK